MQKWTKVESIKILCNDVNSSMGMCLKDNMILGAVNIDLGIEEDMIAVFTQQMAFKPFDMAWWEDIQ